MVKEAILHSYDGRDARIKLNNEKKPYAVEDILDINIRVYDDMRYEVELRDDEPIESVIVYVNDEVAESVFKDNMITFIGKNEFVFNEIIGFVQLTFRITYNDESIKWMYSDYISVLIKSTSKNIAIDSMLKYVYKNQIDILRSEGTITDIGEGFDNTFDDFWSQIVLFEEIAAVYENNYGYFMANCRYKLEQKEVLDRVEKLQYVDSKTIQYIVQHPEYLKREVSGIRYGRQTFLPTKTVMKTNHITYDIYENQVVMSFLKLIYDELSVLKESVNGYINVIAEEPESEEGYIVSSQLLYMNAKEVLTGFLEKLSELDRKYQNLVGSYSGILNVTYINMRRQPEPTAILLNVPQYNRVYMCIRRWFGRVGYNLINERVMLDFSNVPAIYEAYVLIKLINQIRDSGYELTESKCVIYPKNSNWKYKNKKYNNTFIFKDENSEVVLYYEPVIYDEDRSSVNGINLYRNNSISINKESEEEMQGHYYVPDYIIKYKEDDKEKYIICDAKFMRRNKVRFNMIPDLSFKYLTSISPLSESAEVKGLYIFYGLNEEEMKSRSFYDNHVRDRKKIVPQIELVPLSESISYADQTDNAREMLRSIVSMK